MSRPAARRARAIALAYGLLCYAAFAAVFVYQVGFMGGFPVPRAVDGPARAGTVAAAAIDVALLALFGLQHSVMARAGFKRAWTRVVPAPVERSTYVLATCVAYVALFALWQPVPGDLWRVGRPAVRGALWALFWSGWALAFVSSALIDHFALFGVRQVVAYATGRAPAAPAFRLRGPYRVVRHPILLGFLLSAWCVPDMSYGHVLFSAGMSIYIWIGMRLEERDLARTHPEYETYRRTVPALLPIPRS